jgi:hypothetical protein
MPPDGKSCRRSFQHAPRIKTMATPFQVKRSNRKMIRDGTDGQSEPTSFGYLLSVCEKIQREGWRHPEGIWQSI